MRFLHISDLHLKTPGTDGQDEVFEAFLTDVRSVANESPIDAIIFTGDLVHSGSSVERFKEASTRVLEPLCSAANVPAKDLLLLPGNHDISPEGVDIFAENGLREALLSDQAVDVFLASAQQRIHGLNRVSNFYDFADTRSPTTSEDVPLFGRRKLLSIGESVVHIALADSAWRATGRPDSEDKGRLIIGRHQLRELRPTTDGCTLRIFAAHHPPDWLTEFDRSNLDYELPSFYDLALFGHNHTSVSVLRRDGFGELVTSHAGALYQHSKGPNSYTIIAFDEHNRDLTLTFRSWVPRRRCFDVDTSSAVGGRLTYHLTAAASHEPSNAIQQATRSDTRLSLHETLSTNIDLLQRTVRDDIDPLDLLIEPPLYPIRDGSSDVLFSGGVDAPRISIDEWLADSYLLLVYGEPQAGKTSALNWMLRSSSASSGRYPVFLDFREISTSKQGVARSVRKALLRAGMRLREDLTDLPPLVIAIDNFSPGDLRRRESVLSFISDHPGQKVVLSLNDDGIAASPETWVPTDQDFHAAHLGRYKAREIRLLTMHLFPAASETWESIVAAAISILLNQGIARTPWNVVMILMIFRYEPAIAAADVTALVDKYVDLILGKWQSTDDATIEGLDFVNRKHYLSTLASHMARTTRVTISEDELLAFTVSYLSEYGLEISAERFIRDLMERHVLAGSRASIRFAPPDLRQFFLALAARSKLISVDEILPDLNAHFSALVHFAGLERDREDVLRTVSNRLRTISSSMDLPPTSLFSSMAARDWSDLPELSVSLEGLRRMGHEVGLSQTQAAEDDYADDLLAHRAELDDEEIGPNHDEIVPDSESDDALDAERGLELLLSHCALLSLCLQRSELVPNQQLKVEVTKQCLEGWAHVFAAAAALEASMSAEDRTRRDEALKQIGLTPSQIHDLAQFGAFVDVGAMAQSTLGSAKLGKALRTAGTDPDLQEELVPSILQALIMAAEDISGWDDAVTQVLNSFGERAHVKVIVQGFLAGVYFQRGTGDDQQKRIEGILGRMSAEAHGAGPGGKLARSLMIQTLRDTRARSIALQLDRASNKLE